MKCKIKNVDYDLSLVTGVPFTDKYNESLDTSSIIIDQVEQIQDLKPFDDVFLYDGGEFKGFSKSKAQKTYLGKVITTKHKERGTQKNYAEELEKTIVSQHEINFFPIFRWANFAINYDYITENDAPDFFNNKLTFTLSLRDPDGSEYGKDLHIAHRHYQYQQGKPEVAMTLVESDTDTDKVDVTLHMNDNYLETKPYTYHDGTVIDIKVNQYNNLYQPFVYYNNISISFSDEVKKDPLWNSNAPIMKINYKDNGASSFWLLALYGENDRIHGACIKGDLGDVYFYLNADKTKWVAEILPHDFSHNEVEVEYILLEDTNKNVVPLPPFFKHYLIDTYEEIQLNLTDKPLYKYKISLFSETKRLETIILPNISVTQPLTVSLKKTAWKYLNQFVNMYSPMIKYATSEKEQMWTSAKRYSLDPNLEVIYKSIYCPDFSLNTPNLRDVLTQIMLTKDRIPYVKNNVIYGMNVTARTATFDANPEYISFISNSMDSSEYTQNLRRSYNNAISQDNQTNLIEYMGFRNGSDNQGLLTLKNMRLETRFPIYKINKIYMCYYKYIIVNGVQKVMLCKQDITPLVVLNDKRNLLNSDWEDFSTTEPKTIEEMAKYKLCTLGYNIGDNYISGWGETYDYPVGWWQVTKSYLENILSLLDLKISPLGILSYGYIQQQLNRGSYIDFYKNLKDSIISAFDYGNVPYMMKSMLFKIDYTAFYNGTIIHTKENNFGEITTTDNSSSSLTILENDGIFEKEKVNRLGNKIKVIRAVYPNSSFLQPLGAVFEDDYIVYWREYAIYDTYCECNYYLTKDYVLKSYYTTVYAKHRVYNLLPYNESVNRAENRKIFLYLSDENEYYENYDSFELDNALSSFEETLTNCFVANPIMTTKDNFDKSEQINVGYFDTNHGTYLSDINKFVSGNSLCFNLRMYDNVSGGVYIKYPMPSTLANIIGSGQSWNMMIDNKATGFIHNLGVHIAHIDTKELYLEGVFDDDDSTTYREQYTDIFFNMPKISFKRYPTQQIGKTYELYKDNKEIIDFTFQIEPIIDSKKFFLSPWFMKINNLIGNYNKVNKTYKVIDIQGEKTGYEKQANLSSQHLVTTGAEIYDYYPTIQLYIVNTTLDDKIIFNGYWNHEFPTGDSRALSNANFAFVANYFVAIGSEAVIINSTCTYSYESWGKKYNYSNIFNVTFTKLAEGNYYRATIKNFPIQGSLATVPCRAYNGYYIDESPSQPAPFFLNPSNSLSDTYYIMSPTVRIESTYTKNLYVLQRSEEITKEPVYDEITNAQIGSGKKFFLNDELVVNNIFEYHVDETRQTKSIRVNLEQLNKKYPTAEFWFWDELSNSYHFVFGVNPTPEDWTRGFAEISISLLSSSNMDIYDQNNNLIGVNRNYKKTTANLIKRQVYDKLK